ncbi:SRPBCC family protein [Arthrobacter globiformis]|uniref:SRPBCC family protein n=1 Tax=Arthrobacter globiformis TaxID=1665 RepID=UPI002793EE29|nr:SRPBCC family protein [Arthrobacter globiformis]MDQ0618351.1 uncharacterized protein YndB with AHSA1/START domain [Arthrobacter globiformis]
MKIEVSVVIDRPPAVVFEFYVVNHVRNHPRWDPNIQLTQLTEGPVRVGTRIERRHTRAGTPIEGIMEVVELDPGKSMKAVIVDQTPDGPLEVHGRVSFEAVDGDRTKLTLELDMPHFHSSMEPSLIEGGYRRIKELVEAET